jgi:hypothetical protein
MSWRRALLAWLAIAVAESVHGILRRIFVLPVIGELRAHQVGIFVGCIIIFAIAWVSIRWVGARSTSELLKVGAVWMVLMAAFEVSLGYAFGYPLSQILQDYNVAEGRLMIFGMAFMLIAPTLAAKARGISAHSANNSPQGRR